MRVSEWVIYFQMPIASNSWAFVEEFAYHNKLLYDASFDEILVSFWNKVSEIYSILEKTGNMNWHPVDFYFTFLAKSNFWSFALHAKDPLIYNKSFMCTRDIYISTKKITTEPIDIECYFSNIKTEDMSTLKKIFKGLDPVSTGNFIKIKM